MFGLFKQRTVKQHTVICRKCGHVISKDRAVKKVSNQFVGSSDYRRWADGLADGWADVDIYFCEEHAPKWDREEQCGYNAPHYYKILKEEVDA